MRQKFLTLGVLDGTRVVIDAGYDRAAPAQEAAIAEVISSFEFSAP